MKLFMSVAFLTLAVTGTTYAAQSCDAHCLRKVADTYLRALEEGKPQEALLAPSARLVESGKIIKAGEGVWTQHVKLRSQQYFTDPAKGGIVLYGAADVGGKLSSFFLRLKVAGGKVTESETVSQGGEPGTKSDRSGLLEPDLIYVVPVPPGRRSTPAELQRVVESYLEAIRQHDPTRAPFSPRCDRYSSGMKFTNNLEVVPISENGGTCGSSLANLKSFPLTDVRFPVVDESLGIAVAHFIIRMPAPEESFNVAEIFKVVDGKIRSIEEFTYRAPSPSRSGFELDR